jgi:two-component system cell cycle sensor histidine kinase/response regulator CckA
VALAFAACALSVHPFHRATGSVLVVSFFMIPAALAGAFWGKKGGVGGGVLSLVAACVMVVLVSPSQLLSAGIQGLVFFVGIGAIIGHTSDLTQRLSAEAAGKDRLLSELARSEARYRGLFDRVPVGLYRTEPSGKIVAANRAVADMLGYTDTAGLLRADANDLYADRPRRQEFVELHGRKGVVHDFEAKFRKADGGTMWVAVSAVAEVDSSGALRTIESAIRDISEHKRIEEQSWVLDALRLRLERIDAAGQLAAGVAHDLNNILAAISTHAQLILRRAGAEDKAAGTSAQKIVDATDRAARIAEGLLLSAGTHAYSPEPSELGTEVREVARKVEMETRPGVTLELDLTTAPLMVALDRSLFAVALREIVNNAVAATRGGGAITLRTGASAVDLLHVYVSSPEPSALHAFASVHDRGSGMDPDALRRVFEPYFTTQGFGKGAGLGLSRVSGIVRQHGGAVAVWSAPGSGTTVTL